ncbi:hypothetical protein O181_026052 [Austropuccinia psidii MF-1]|uniref:Uncharacterized protein n=1 Tax=Austropuccinia psidii MF-1 TaxID=1389203 RepID=A0A9Q3CMD4_9BASI|nr:hypothetical protein [Austropuccinia psidii MF-1]
MSTFSLNKLKATKKMRDLFVGPLIIISQIGRNSADVKFTKEFSTKYPVFPVSLIKLYHQTDYRKFHNSANIFTHEKLVEEKYSPGPVKKIIKAGNISINGKDNRQYLVRFKNQPEDKYKWLS